MIRPLACDRGASSDELEGITYFDGSFSGFSWQLHVATPTQSAPRL
jgi:hypothetical protein